MDFDDSEFDNFIQIGKGSYGTVFGNQTIVFKLMNLIMIDNDNQFAFIDNNIRELVLYKTIHYKNIIKDPNVNYTYSLIPDKKPSSIPFYQDILVKKSNHTVKLVMKNHGIPLNKFNINQSTISSKKLNLSIIKIDFLNVLIHQIGNAILYLHESNFSHGDLKPNNILCNFNNHKLTFNLIDFGSVCFNHTDKIYYKFHRTTILYCSPEECEIDHKYYKENDIWSFGCIIYEMFTGSTFLKDLLIQLKQQELFYDIYVHYSKQEYYETLYNIFMSTSQDIIDNLIKERIDDQLVRDKVLKCLIIDRTKRITIDKLINKELKNDVKHDLYTIEYNSIKKNSYLLLRPQCIEIAKKICDKKWLGNPYVYGHSIMLFDRFLIRTVQYTKENYDLVLVLLLCITLSTIVLNCEIVKSTDIIEEYHEFTKVSLSESEILQTFYLLVEKFDFLFFNYSFDLYFKDKSFETIVEITKKYILSNNTTYGLIEYTKNIN